MTRRIIFYFMAVITLTMGLSETVLIVAVHRYFYDGVKETLLDHAEASNAIYQKFNQNVVIDRWNNPMTEVLDSFSVKNTDLQVFDAQGNMVGSSTGLISHAQVVFDRRLYSGHSFSQVEHAEETGEKVMAVYYPIHIDRKLYILRYVSSLHLVDRELLIIACGSLACALMIALIVFFISLRFAESIVTPLKHIIQISSEMATGNFKLRMREEYQAELGILAHTLNQMASEIQKTDKLKNEFIASVSHELLTPLTGIKGWSETMLMNTDMSRGELEEGLAVINQETDRLRVIVGDLLDFSKIQQNTMKLYREQIYLDDVLRSSVASLLVKADAKRCRVKVSLPSRGRIFADQVRIQQVLINLLDNAIKFSDEGKEISVRLWEEHGEACVSVRDEGVLVDPADLPRLTDAFFQTKTTGKGSGLGLSISKNIAERHGGSLSFSSSAESGTVALLRLPLFAG
ncbi:MAG: HAMP domain-containing sensor histidine kinase [Sporolactobacillus sp.]